jgi:lipoprotein-anchoring transpeptidase ErfK/SrfK
MASPSLESKTVRPGSLGMYYRSARRPDHSSEPAFITGSRRKLVPKRLVITVAIVAALVAIPLVRADNAPKKPASGQASTSKTAKSPKTAPTAPAAAAVATAAKPADRCAGNSRAKLALVSISQRHMWGCEQGKTVYDAPVITGMSAHASTVTPAGTYQIYGKQRDTVLTGSDETGSWNDPVSYWMPFLDNQYGTYGFHDATWRPGSEFGNVSPDSSDASHGCVELPLEAAAWLNGWAGIGTTVKIEN